MLIGSRGCFLKHKKKTLSAKDYIQDGLIAMWDGIENAEWGVHISYLGGCVNLVSPNSFDTPYTDLVIGSDYAEVADYNPYINLTNAEGSISWQIAQAWTSTDGGATVEIVLNNSGNNGTTRGLVAAGAAEPVVQQQARWRFVDLAGKTTGQGMISVQEYGIIKRLLCLAMAIHFVSTAIQQILNLTRHTPPPSSTRNLCLSPEVPPLRGFSSKVGASTPAP